MIRKLYSAGVIAVLFTSIHSLAHSGSALLTTNRSSLALSVKNPHKHIALTGKPRQFVIHNKSQLTAEKVHYTLSMNFPADASIFPASCGDIAPGDDCILTITPGKTPSAEPGMMSMPVNVTLKGSNTNALLLRLDILDYGSMYQQGWVFSINDMPSSSASIAGKVAALQDAVNSPAMWSADNIIVSGIDEVSTQKNPSPTNPPGVTGCEGNLNGACASEHIITQDTENVAAKTCSYYSIDNSGNSPCQKGAICYKNWYLPAICEMGYDTFGIGTGCGTLDAPSVQNMELNLVYNTVSHVGLSGGTYWSATEVSGGNQQNYAWFQVFSEDFITNQQLYEEKKVRYAIRCVRAF